MQPTDRRTNSIATLSEAGAELVPNQQARQIEIRLAHTYLMLTRQQARGLMLELAAFLSDANSDKTPCVITLD